MTNHPPASSPASFIATFDVEEHHRIEAAVGLDISPGLKADYAKRMEATTYRLLEQLAAAGVLSTFYIVGEIAQTHPGLVRAIYAAGHEVGSHSWDHQRVHRLGPDLFRLDLLRSKGQLEQTIGAPIYGFRAPTFSIDRSTGWAIDILAECGFVYDSSIFPVRHDRYGMPDAPRGPFLALGEKHEILEVPPLTLRYAGTNIPVAGGGYFRLFPLGLMQAGLSQVASAAPPAVGMLYFHPWEFDPGQHKLPLSRFNRWRTYIGTSRTTKRLGRLLSAYPFRRAIDVVREIQSSGAALPRFSVVGPKAK